MAILTKLAISPKKPVMSRVRLIPPARHLLIIWYGPGVETYGLPVVVTNCSNNYGGYQFPEKLIPLILINILEGRPLPVYGNGGNIRDWLYVDDHCQGIELILVGGRVGEVYNIGGNNEWSSVEIVRLLCKKIDELFGNDASLAQRFPKAPAVNGQSIDTLITYVNDRPGHDWRYAIDANKISTELGYHTRETFETGILKTICWYVDNEVWWRAVMDGSYQDWVNLQYSK